MPASTTRYTTTLVPNEQLILTVSQKGEPSEEEIRAGQRYLVRFNNSVFAAFEDPSTSTSYSTPTALCKAKLQRNGPLATNEWRGPRHCLVYRNGTWTPIGNL